MTVLTAEVGLGVKEFALADAVVADVGDDLLHGVGGESSTAVGIRKATMRSEPPTTRMYLLYLRRSSSTIDQGSSGAPRGNPRPPRRRRRSWEVYEGTGLNRPVGARRRQRAKKNAPDGRGVVIQQPASTL